MNFKLFLLESESLNQDAIQTLRELSEIILETAYQVEVQLDLDEYKKIIGENLKRASFERAARLAPDELLNILRRANTFIFDIHSRKDIVANALGLIYSLVPYIVVAEDIESNIQFRTRFLEPLNNLANEIPYAKRIFDKKYPKLGP